MLSCVLWYNSVHKDMGGVEMKTIVRRAVMGIIIAMCTLSCSCASTEPEEIEIEPQYSIQELLQLEDHPCIFDEYSDVENYYNNINDKRIAVVDVQGHYQMERKIKSIGDDPIVLYLIKDATYHKYLGSIQINLFQPEICRDMDLEKAVKMVADYLPSDFLTYYKNDSSYQYTNNNVSVYTYSVRLSNPEIRPDYGSYYYNFKIFHYEERDLWCIKTGPEAYGDHGLDWINKYAEDWEIDLSDYFSAK